MSTKAPNSVYKLARLSMCAALIAVCAWLSVPAAIPFTMQTFAVCLVAALFGRRTSLGAVGMYLFLGAVGLPVFSNFQGGFGVLLGVTGGYLWGFLLMAFAVGLAVDRFGRSLRVLLISMAQGTILCYAFGTLWFVLVYNRSSGPIGVMTALSLCVLPYVVPDAVKILLAAVLTQKLYPILNGGAT